MHVQTRGAAYDKVPSCVDKCVKCVHVSGQRNVPIGCLNVGR